MSEKESGRYTEKEAIKAQELATEQEGLDFSEQASPEAYAEAEKVIEQLRDSKFDWLGVDWDGFDLRDIKQEIHVTDKLNTALETVGSQGKRSKGPRKLLTLLAAASALIVACEKQEVTPKAQATYEKAVFELDRARSAESRVIDSGGNFPDYQVSELNQWMEHHGHDFEWVGIKASEEDGWARIQLNVKYDSNAKRSGPDGQHHLLDFRFELPDSTEIALSRGKNAVERSQEVRLIWKDREMQRIIEELEKLKAEFKPS